MIEVSKTDIKHMLLRHVVAESSGAGLGGKQVCVGAFPGIIQPGKCFLGRSLHVQALNWWRKRA